MQMQQPNYRHRHPAVFARQADRTLTIIHDSKGEQTARKGDWLVGTERGQIEVVKLADFAARYEPISTEQASLSQIEAQLNNIVNDEEFNG